MKHISVILLFFSALQMIFAGEIIVNQTGYTPELPKRAYTTSPTDSFFVVEVSTQIIFFRGPLELSVTNDPSTGLTLYKGDFTQLQRPGEYYIRTSSNDQSYNFKIAHDVYDDIFRKSLKAFYFQRCGLPLLQINAGVYQRSECHINDANLHPSTSQTGFWESSGGWHDAGDYGKYVVNSGISAGTLLMAYDLDPEKFSTDNLNIPESGNSIPDILDEVRYEISWLLKMQHPNGGIYFKLTPEQFEPFVMPAQANAARYIYELSTTATGNFAAVLAKFSRLYAPYDSAFANTCLSAAVQAWNYLINQPSIVPPGGFHNPAGTYTGVYGDMSDTDERLWAAAELFETTGETEYKDYFDFNYDQDGVFNSTMWWARVHTLAQLTYLFSERPEADTGIRSVLASALGDYCDELLQRNLAAGFGITLVPGEFVWGSNSGIMNNALLLIYGFRQFNDTNYLKAALDQMNYILGQNGHNFSFVSGTGSSSMMHPHHRPSEADGIQEPIPGLVAGGPDQYLSDPVLQQNFNSNTPPAMCYIDDVGSYASNEIAINWNAPLVFLSGYFSSGQATSIDEETYNQIPGSFQLYQNFPNPFNPATRIEFNLPSQAYVKLIVLNCLGEKVVTLCDQIMPEGLSSLYLNAQNMPSGIYFYSINSSGFSDTKKMVLLK